MNNLKTPKSPGTVKKTGLVYAGNSVDIWKFFCTVLIVGSHCLPLFNSDMLNFCYGQWFFRFCVPFFFIATGFFFAGMDEQKRRIYIVRICTLYLISTTIYLPLIIKGAGSVTGIIYNIIFGYYHLWYLSALIIGLVLVELTKRTSLPYTCLIALILPGALFDEYYKLFDVPMLNKLAQYITYIGGARHSLFFAFPLLLVGRYIAEHERKLNNARCVVFISISMILGFIEANLLRDGIGGNISLDVSLFGFMPAIPMFILALNTRPKISAVRLRTLRKITDIVYIVHIWVALSLPRLFGIKAMTNFVMTFLISLIISILWEGFVKQKIAGKRTGKISNFS